MVLRCQNTLAFELETTLLTMDTSIVLSTWPTFELKTQESTLALVWCSTSLLLSLASLCVKFKHICYPSFWCLAVLLFVSCFVHHKNPLLSSSLCLFPWLDLYFVPYTSTSFIWMNDKVLKKTSRERDKKDGNTETDLSQDKRCPLNGKQWASE